MPGLIWKWCCGQVCKALYQVSPLLGCHQYTQQSLLLRAGPAEAAAPHGGHTQWKLKLPDFVSITRELVRKACTVDLNVYINISPKALWKIYEKMLYKWIKWGIIIHKVAHFNEIDSLFIINCEFAHTYGYLSFHWVSFWVKTINSVCVHVENALHCVMKPWAWLVSPRAACLLLSLKVPC